MSEYPTVTEVNCQTGEQVERPMTDQEYTNFLKLQEAAALRETALN